jgi:hypothetical protein
MELREILSRDLETQWKDHFHMRDQMWKMIQIELVFFIGVVGLNIAEVNKTIVILAYIAIFLTSIIGLVVTSHLRKRQKEKFKIIIRIEKELGIYAIIEDILDKSKENFFGKIDTSYFIRYINILIMLISIIAIVFIIIGIPATNFAK